MIKMCIRDRHYLYPHDYPGSWVDQQYLPDALRNAAYYVPGNNNNEQAYHCLLYTSTYEPAYRCTCSRQKVERALLSMKPEELLQLPDDEGKVEATCQFCDAVYRFSAKDLEVLAAESARTTK